MDRPSTDNLPPQPQKKTQQRSRAAAWVVGALAASLIAGLLLIGWYVVPPFWPSLMPLGAGFLSLGGDRIGRPATAAVVPGCITKISGFGEAANAEPSRMYVVLRDFSFRAGGKFMFDPSDADDHIETARQWGWLAHCIYAREGRALCDPDNRAAAVESLTKFILHLHQGTEWLQKEAARTAGSAQLQRIMEDLKSGLLSALRRHRRDGVLVPSDFGFFPPAEISEVMREEKTTRNICGS